MFFNFFCSEFKLKIFSIRNNLLLCQLPDASTKSYILIDTYFQACSLGCLTCISSTKCLKCAENFYLNYQKGQYACSPCFSGLESRYCQKCGIFNKKTYQSVTSDDFQYIDLHHLNYEEYANSNQFQFVCFSCPSNFLMKSDLLCYGCDNLINNCKECYYREEKLLYITSFDFFLNPSSNPNVECSLCSPVDRFPYFQKINSDYVSSCPSCIDLIPNCKKCMYGLFENETITFYSSLVNNTISLLNEPNFSLRCNECNLYYGMDKLANNCVECPENCEYCSFNSKISKMFCGRCMQKYVLLIYEGNCILLSTFLNVTNIKLTTYCSRIVSHNPWVQYIKDASQYLCQECVDNGYYPSISGLCLQCPYDYHCQNCGEKLQSIEDGKAIKIDLTPILIMSPLDLLQQIKYSIEVKGLLSCLSCGSQDHFDEKYNRCCSKFVDLPTSSLRARTSSCYKCNECQIYESNQYSCKRCSDCRYIAPNLIFQKFPYLEYQKLIYNNIIDSGSNFESSPGFNLEEKKTFTSMKDYEILLKDILGSEILDCSRCSIGSVNCYIKDTSKVDLISLVDEQNKYYGLLTYYMASTKCYTGFIFDKYLERCKFCPQKWLDCEAYKVIQIYFLHAKSNFNNKFKYQVNSLDDLVAFIKNFEASEINYIANEFMLKRLEFQIILDCEFELILKSNTFAVELNVILQKRIITLEKYIFSFTSMFKDKYAKVYLACSFNIIGFTDVIFERIQIIPLISKFDESRSKLGLTLSDFPSLKISSGNLEFQYVNITLEYNSNSIGFLKNNVFVQNPVSYSFLEIKNIFFEFKVINSSKISDLIIYSFQPTPILNQKNLAKTNTFLISGQISLIRNIRIISSTILSLRNFIKFQDTQSELILQNIMIEDSTFSSTIFLYCDLVNNFFMNKILIINSNFLKTPFIKVVNQEIINLYIKDVSFSQVILSGISAYQTFLFDVKALLFFESLILQKSNVEHLSIFYHNNYMKMIFCNEVLLQDNQIKDFLFMNFRYDLADQEKVILSNCNLLNNIIDTNYTFEIISIQNLFIVNFNFIENVGNVDIKVDTVSQIKISYYNNLNGIIDSNNYKNPFVFTNIGDGLIVENITVSSILINKAIFNLVAAKTVYSKTISFANMKIDNIIIESSSDAACIDFHSEVFHNITFKNCSFSNIFLSDDSYFSQASTAIRIESYLSTLFIFDSVFKNLTSTGRNNFLYLSTLKAYILSSNFSEANFHTILNHQFDTITDGSFITSFSNDLIIKNSNFVGSFASSGAIYAEFFKTNAGVEILGCRFLGLTSKSNGGAFSFLKKYEIGSLNIEISECSFENISSLRQGGVFYLDIKSKGKFILYNSTFLGVFATEQGGLIYSSNFTIYISNIFLKNTKESTSIFTFLFSSLYFSKISVENIISFNTDYSTVLDCSECLFTDNNSTFSDIKYLVQAFYFINSNATFQNTTFKNASCLASQIETSSKNQIKCNSAIYFFKSNVFFQNLNMEKIECDLFATME